MVPNPSINLSIDMEGGEIDLDIKSAQSFEAGKALISQHLYTESVHCFYYSVLQMMKYRLANCKKGSRSYEEQSEIPKRDKKSSHEWLFYEVNPKFNGKNKVNFKEDFTVLKESRVAADYSKRSFTVDESLECQQTAERLLGKLRNIH